MKKAALAAVILSLCAAAEAQQMNIQTIPPPRPITGNSLDRMGFRLGPRYSNYATDLDINIITIESGRQHAIGLVGEYRAGSFVLDFNVDHDPENGLQVSDLLPFDLGTYERTRGEFTVGWAMLPEADLQAGFRVDSITAGDAAFGGDLFSGQDVEHSAILGGIHVHSTNRTPFGLYGLLRGYIGSMEFNNFDFSGQQDAMGWRFEGGVEIAIGDSNWHAVPGLEFEYLAADPPLKMQTNRFFVNFVYTFPR
jgi:hypothetical protein